MIRQYEPTSLLAPRNTTDAGVTGAWIDTQGLINQGTRELKFVLEVGVGLTDGTAGGSIQSAEDTSGTGAASIATFATVTSVSGVDVQHGVVRAAHRYVRFLGSVATGKNMIIGAMLIGQTRVSP